MCAPIYDVRTREGFNWGGYTKIKATLSEKKTGKFPVKNCISTLNKGNKSEVP